MGKYTPKLRHIATGGGALSMALVGYANVDKLLHGGLEWSDPPVIIAGALAALGAVAIAVANKERSQRPVFAAMLLLAVVASEATGFYNTFEGLLQGRERRAEATRAHNATVTAAQAAADQAQAEVSRLSQEVTAETKAGGCKSICRELKTQLEAAKVDAQAKAEAVKKAGTLRAENIVAATLGVPEVAAEAAPTLLGAYALLAFSILLPMFGHSRREALATERPADRSEDAAVTEVVRRVLAALEKPAESNDELAKRLGVPKGTASKWATAAEQAGAIRRHRDGRKVSLRVA